MEVCLFVRGTACGSKVLLILYVAFALYERKSNIQKKESTAVNDVTRGNIYFAVKTNAFSVSCCRRLSGPKA
jgi:hypothetical protein